MAAVAAQRRKLVRAIQRMRNVERASAWARWAILGAHWFAAGERAAKADIHFRKAALRAASAEFLLASARRDAERSARRRTVSLKSRRVRSVCETNVRRLRGEIERTEGIELDRARG